MIRRILSALCCLMLLSAVISASAAEVPDLDRRGSIRVTMTYEDEAVPGGSLTIYRVADVHVENGADYSFRYTADYENCGVSLDDVEDAKTAKALAAYTAENNISGTSVRIDGEGKASFRDLELGLYLLVQQEAAAGYEKASPFLISVPGQEGDSYIYDVDASPKLELEPAPTTAPPSTEPSTPSDIPQTGLNQWPVPVLVISGVLLAALGGYMVLCEKKKTGKR